MSRKLVGALWVALFAWSGAASAGDPPSILGVRPAGGLALRPAVDRQPLGDWVPLSEQPRTVLAAIAERVKASVRPLPPARVRALLERRYRTLRLMTAEGDWRVPALARRAAVLVPPGLQSSGLCAFIDRMEDAAAANPYLMEFLARTRGVSFPRLAAKVAEEGDRVFPEVVTHALAIELLTSAMIDDFTISEACREHWRRVADADPEFWSVQSVFARLKTKSVNLGIDAFNRSHRAGEVDPKALSWTLPLNILEAVGADLFLSLTAPREARAGHLANARAGMQLVLHGPQGAGPSRFTRDGKLTEIRQKSVKSWDDLYATWNMSFITVVGKWPFFLAKLVIPSVNRYSEEPGSYINRRALALEIQMYANGLELRDGVGSEIDWTDPALTRVWGRTNLESAWDYRWRAQVER